MPRTLGKWALVLGWLMLAQLLPSPWTPAHAKNEDYLMSNVCKNLFLRDIYRKIDGAVLTSQNERNLDCAITFQTHSILQRFMLKFDRLQLDCNDHLYIYDGAHSVGSFKADLSCRNTMQSVGAIYTHTNYVTLKYITDAWGTESNGFRLVITAVKDPKHACKDFRCTLKEFCIGNDLVCDGINHCEDGSDEATSTVCVNPEASTILGMESTWFAALMVALVLAMAGFVTAGVLCFCRQRVGTPRHPYNSHNAQGHQPVSYPSAVVSKRAVDMAWYLGPSARRLVTLILAVFFITTTLLHQVLTQNLVSDGRVENNEFVVTTRDFFIGPCLVNTNNTCPDNEITYHLYTQDNPNRSQEIFVNGTGSNLGFTNFEPRDPTKIIIHGYNSDMQLDSLVDIRKEYLKKAKNNLIAVDWHRYAAGPCYPIAVHNVPHVGKCLAQFVERLREYGASDIHVIGFSLGAHVPAFAANFLKPYKLPRITGLDPAMPLFITVGKDSKLDAEDAEFVDVFHTNAFVQGKVEPSGHADFYMNGGVNQPGCWGKGLPFGCNHHRAAMYFAESINSQLGFWGWPCPGFLAYLLGLCPPRFPAIRAGDPVDRNRKGFYLVKTRSASPFAEGIFTVEPESYSHNL